MHLRPKTKRRIVLLLAAAGVVGAAFAVFTAFQLHRMQTRRSAYRAEGMAAFDRGDYPAALSGLTRYLGDDTTDADAVYASAVSLSRVPSADQSNLTRAISAYHRYLELRPGEPRAQRQLLELYARTGFASEGLSLADQLLQDNPDDVVALTGKLRVLELQSQYPAALAVSEKLDRLQPDDLSNQTETYRLMRLAKQPPTALITRADAMLHAQPGDARCLLLRAIAAYFADDPHDARHWLDLAAASPPPDADFVRVLSSVFDRLGSYDRSLATLEKGADDRRTDAPLLAALVLRQWEDGRCDDAARRLASIDPASPAADTRLLALAALVHFTLSEDADPSTRPATDSPDRALAVADLHALDARFADDTAAEWALLLHARFDHPPAPVRDRITRYETVLTRDPDNAVAPLLLGFDDAELGERDMAVQAWQRAARLSPGWATPHLLIARTLLDAGRIQEAAQAAQAAEDRAPDRLIVQTTLARAAYAQLGSSTDPARLDRLLSFVAAIQSRTPGEPATLPIYVALLARTGHVEQAADVVRRALSSVPPPAASTLNALLRVDQEQKLGLREQIESSRNHNVSVTPADGFARAVADADTGRPDDGLALLQDLSSATGADSVGWQVAMLRYREYTADPGAGRGWASLGDDRPRDASVQRAILASTAAWSDRPLIDRTVTRLQKLTGSDGIEWRLARARFELSSDDSNEQPHAAAAATLAAEVARDAPQSVEALLLWSDAARKLNDLPGARQHCRRAAELAPTDVNVSLALAPLLLGQGNTAEADDVLLRAASAPRLSPEQRIRLARALAARGRYEPAATLLTAAAGRSDPDRDVLLAQIRSAQGDAPAAAELYNKVLHAGVATESFIRAAAWFFADHGQADSARQVLARLDTSPLSPADREILWGDFEEVFGAAPAAKQHFEAAVRDDPKSSAGRTALVGFDLRRRNFSAATEAADDRVRAIVPPLERLPSGAAGDRLLDVASRRPLDEVCRQTLDAAVNHPAMLPAVVQRFPEFVPARLLLADQQIQSGATAAAADTLARAAVVDPTDPSAPRAAAELFRSLGQWDPLVSTATEWRRRSMQDPLSADLALADGYLHAGQPDAALRQLSPYVVFARSSPQSNQTVIRLDAAGLCMTGRTDEARATLEPLLDTSAVWRAIWLQVAAEACPTPGIAAEWIDHVTPMALPAERLTVASTWAAAGVRFGRSDFLVRARAALTTLTGEPNTSPAAWVALADVCREMNDLPAAAAAYRQASQFQPGDAAVSNDYAFALLLSGGDLHAARAAAEAAVVARPASAEFQTTLGRIDSALGDVTAAEPALRQALRADPHHCPALIALAELYVQTGRPADAAPLLDRIDSLARHSPGLSNEQQRRLSSIRDAVQSPAAASIKGPS